MVKITDYSWSVLSEICPIILKDLLIHVETIENSINPKIDLKKLDDYKQGLIIASGELEIMITKLLTILYNVDLIKDDLDKRIYDLLRDDLAGYMSIIDEKQNKLLETHDGDSSAGIGRTSAFKKILQVSLYGLIYHSLYFSSIEYRNLKKLNTSGKEIKKDKNDFLRILFMVVSMNLDALGGLPRRRTISGGAVGSKMINPRSVFSKEFEEMINKEHQEKFTDEFPELKDEKEDEDSTGVDEEYV